MVGGVSVTASVVDLSRSLAGTSNREFMKLVSCALDVCEKL